ncbi:MAG: MerR family transcriptional regulator [Ruminococcaceae bacterium]|nr:MerR family transcriptional regulator [Oscillospiraceae bacterium]
MLKIGEFARICHVSTQTLRYYHAEGVLCADRIDPQTGYRYYKTEKIKTFGEIQTLKQAGFSLEEIKILMGGSEEARMVMLARKRTALTEDRNRIDASLALVERLGHRQEILGELTRYQALTADFENDPEVIGRWRLMGQVRTQIPETWGNPKPPSDTVMDEFVCLPGGSMWWNILWSRGVIYCFYQFMDTVVPNEYQLHDVEGHRYMTLRWIGYNCLTKGSDSIILLYKQESNRAYTPRESQTRRDRTDFPYIPDPSLQGTWETVAYVDTPENFSPSNPLDPSVLQYVTAITFYERGICKRHLRHDGRAFSRQLEYTASGMGTFRGYIINQQDEAAEGYLIRELDGVSYLFIQHKSGDYFFGGMEPKYYVFRKVDEGTAP